MPAENYVALGFEPTTTHKRTIKVSSMADTGCQSCLASMKVVERLGLCKHDLILVTMQKHAANNDGIKILGAAIMRFTGKSKTSKTLKSLQVIYVTSDSDKLFLSHETCTTLGIITKDFPTLGEALQIGTDENASHPTSFTCDCPKRERSPPKPSQLPFPATEANRKRLEQWFLDYYKSNAFNMCTNQPLPLMDVPPMRLMIDLNTKLVAYHTPIPVPLHWQDIVKAGLDKDMALGVIESVSVGEPITWCHHMVICAKKNGQPRHTIDFQPLNLHATREMHHTQTGLPLARKFPCKSKFGCFLGAGK